MKLGLQVKEVNGISRKSFPITGGIPLKEGLVEKQDSLCMYDSEEKSLPLEWKALTCWPDGSVRWALLDFQTDLNANETRSLELKNEPQDRLSPIEAAGIVDGEPLPRRQQGVSLTGSFLRVVDGGGNEWITRESGATIVEHAGALRRTLCTSGSVISPDESRRIRWESRTDFYRDKDWTRTRFTYMMDAGAGPAGLNPNEPKPEPVYFKELAVVARINPNGKPRYYLSTSNARWVGSMDPIISDKPGMVVQIDENSSRVVTRDGEELKGQSLKNRGWVGVYTEPMGLAMGLADFWQSFPKIMRTTEQTLEAVLWPAEVETHIGLFGGMARTHTITLSSFQTSAQANDLMASVTTPILPVLSIKDMNATGVMPALLPRKDSPAPFLEAMTELMFVGYGSFTTRDNAGVWGFGELDFGDFQAPGYEARRLATVYGEGVIWGNHETQVPYGFLTQYLRTGKIEYLIQGLACARHEADVDTIHDAVDKSVIGAQREHGANHMGVITTSHMWTSGIALAYLLTGDGRLKAVLEETGEYLLSTSAAKPLSAFASRDGGWLMLALCANYEALGDQRYLVEARHALDGLRYWIIDGGAKDSLPGAGRVFSTVMLFIQLSAVADYWRLTKNELARETLLLGGEMAIEHGRSDLDFFMMMDGPSYRYPNTWVTGHCLPVMNVLYEMTGDMKWIEVGLHQARLLTTLLEANGKWWLQANWSQGGIFYSYAFQFFETARKLGLLQDIR